MKFRLLKNLFFWDWALYWRNYYRTLNRFQKPIELQKFKKLLYKVVILTVGVSVVIFTISFLSHTWDSIILMIFAIGNGLLANLILNDRVPICFRSGTLGALVFSDEPVSYKEFPDSPAIGIGKDEQYLSFSMSKHVLLFGHLEYGYIEMVRTLVYNATQPTITIFLDSIDDAIDFNEFRYDPIKLLKLNQETELTLSEREARLRALPPLSGMLVVTDMIKIQAILDWALDLIASRSDRFHDPKYDNDVRILFVLDPGLVSILCSKGGGQIKESLRRIAFHGARRFVQLLGIAPQQYNPWTLPESPTASQSLRRFFLPVHTHYKGRIRIAKGEEREFRPVESPCPAWKYTFCLGDSKEVWKFPLLSPQELALEQRERFKSSWQAAARDLWEEAYRVTTKEPKQIVPLKIGQKSKIVISE